MAAKKAPSVTNTDKVYYRVVEDQWDEGPIDVIVQTTDPTDEDFDEACDHCLASIQQRIDEATEEKDGAYLEKLQEKLGDTEAADWEDYTSSMVQPEIMVNGELVNIAEVTGRIVVQEYLNAGGKLDEYGKKSWARIWPQVRNKKAKKSK